VSGRKIHRDNVFVFLTLAPLLRFAFHYESHQNSFGKSFHAVLDLQRKWSFATFTND
jgi:hypothetical protein